MAKKLLNRNYEILFGFVENCCKFIVDDKK